MTILPMHDYPSLYIYSTAVQIRSEQVATSLASHYTYSAPKEKSKTFEITQILQ